LVSVCYFIGIANCIPAYYVITVEAVSDFVGGKFLFRFAIAYHYMPLIESNYLVSRLYSMNLACSIKAIIVFSMLKILIGSLLLKPSTGSCRYLYKHARVLIHFNNAKMKFCKAVVCKGLWNYTSSSLCQILTGGRAEVVLHPDFFHVL